MGFWKVHIRWLRDRTLSTLIWTIGIAVIVVASAAFYPSLSGMSTGSGQGGGEAMSSLLGLGQGIDPGSPLGFLWISLYANVFPWMLMALGVALGVAAIAGDENTGALEYLLAKPVTRTTVAFARFAGVVTILVVASVVSAIALTISLPLFKLADAVTTINAAGSPVTSPGATAANVFNRTFASFAVALGLAGVAFLLGGVTGRKSIAMGGAAGIGIGGYVLYTMSNMTGSLKPLTWLSPWRWYVSDAMLINGLSWAVVLPFVTAVVGFLVGWIVFTRRDLQSS